ncbi:MAG: 4-phosphoerythronate dehydrogenase [Bacteroidota bacterium]
MSRIRVIADEKIPFLKGVLEDRAEVLYLPGKQINAGHVRDADALLVRTRTRCESALLGGSRVSFVGTATIGYDHIDHVWCEQNGITWTNSPGCNAGSVEQYIVSVLLNLVRDRNLKLKNLTLGVIGVGHVGSRVVRAAKAMGMQVLMNDPPRERLEGKGVFTSLDNLLDRSDIVTLHVPLNRTGDDITLGLAGKDFMDRMKVGSVLINSSRGEVVDPEVLRVFLKQGKFGAVVLDVFDNEPNIDPEILAGLSIATPHIAGYSTDGKANGTSMVVRALSRKFRLGLDDWSPVNVPVPAETEILHDPSGFTFEESLAEIYLATYDVKSDHRRLAEDPSAFEQLRGDYPLRREPGVYTARVFTAYPELDAALNGLGFNVIKDSCF